MDFNHSAPSGPTMHQHIKFQHNRTMHGSVIDDLANFPHMFFRRGICISYYSLLLDSELSGQNYANRHDPNECFRFPTMLLFELSARQRQLGSEIEANFRTFLSSVKLGERWTTCLSDLLFMFNHGANLWYRPTFPSAPLRAWAGRLNVQWLKSTAEKQKIPD